MQLSTKLKLKHLIPREPKGNFNATQAITDLAFGRFGILLESRAFDFIETRLKKEYENLGLPVLWECLDSRNSKNVKQNSSFGKDVLSYENSCLIFEFFILLQGIKKNAHINVEIYVPRKEISFTKFVWARNTIEYISRIIEREFFFSLQFTLLKTEFGNSCLRKKIRFA